MKNALEFGWLLKLFHKYTSMKTNFICYSYFIKTTRHGENGHPVAHHMIAVTRLT